MSSICRKDGGVTIVESSDSNSYKLSLDRRSEKGSLTLTASQSVSASSSGTPNEKIEARGKWVRRLTNKLTASVTAVVFQQESTSQVDFHFSEGKSTQFHAELGGGKGTL